MQSIEAFKNFQLKLDKLDTEDNVDISPGEFVIIYNEVQNIWFESKYKNVSTRRLDEIQNLVEPDYNLIKVGDKDSYSEFEIPNNYFDYIRSYSLGTKGNCKDRIIYNNEVKLVNLSLYLSDEYNSPSFEFQETLITISNNKLQVYKKDFSVDSVFCTYYRYPKQIDIQGYTKLGVASTNIDPDLEDKQVQEVINLCVLEAQRRYLDVEGFQLSQTRKQDSI